MASPYTPPPAEALGTKVSKVFCFFFAKKKRFAWLHFPFPPGCPYATIAPGTDNVENLGPPIIVERPGGNVVRTPLARRDPVAIAAALAELDIFLIIADAKLRQTRFPAGDDLA